MFILCLKGKQLLRLSTEISSSRHVGVVVEFQSSQFKVNLLSSILWLKSDWSACIKSTALVLFEGFSYSKPFLIATLGQLNGRNWCVVSPVIKRWVLKQLSVSEVYNKEPLCSNLFLSLLSIQLPDPRKQELFETLVTASSEFYHNVCLASAMAPRQQLYFPPASFPKQAFFLGCTHELPCIQSGQCWVSTDPWELWKTVKKAFCLRSD